jgi:hypothetical protein
VVTPKNPVWIFNGGSKLSFPGGAFCHKEIADDWIKRNKLSGVLTAYPLDEGCLEWAIANDCVGMKPSTFAKKKDDPAVIGSFSTASQAHYHYKNGTQVSF